MSYSITLPFYAFKLHFVSGGTVSIPLQKNNAVRIKQSVQKIAKSYAEEFQKNVVDKGGYEKILEEMQSGDFSVSEVFVAFPAAKDGFSYPSFELEFDFYYRESEKGYWGIVPTLGIEAFAEDRGKLRRALETAILQDFSRQKRFSTVQGVIDAIWYDSSELLEQEISLKFHSPNELASIEKDTKQEWLPKVASILKIEEKVTYGRAEEMNRLSRAMKGNFGRNILLVGASGVGKTALIWELVHRQKQLGFKGKIWETTASVLIKELTQDTGWQDNIAHVIREISQRGDVLFVRNLLELFEVGKYQGNSISIAEYLVTYLSRGEVSIISECTEQEKSRIELRSPNFLSNFQIIPLTEPTKDLEEIILQKVQDLAAKNQTEIEAEAIQETIRLNKRFTPYSGFPGKPIRFLESILLSGLPTSEEITNALIARSDVIKYFCEETGMPAFMVDPEIPMFPNQIKAQFNNAVFGQEPAVESVVNMLSTVKTGLSKTGKPIASFLFVGPTGVGKTELAKVLSEFMFGSRDRMVRFDMSEYSGYDAVSKLLGQGYFSDGVLTSTVRREPFCVLLFDEIEKANPDFFDLLLQMLSEGRLTDSRGKLVNFCSTIIIMTSNIGAAALQRRNIGMESKNKKDELAQRYMKAVQDYFKPEMFNRIDQVIPFASLSKDTVRFVVEREIEELKKREGIRYRRMDLNIEEEVLDYLAKVGYDERYGARYLQRAFRQKLIIPMAQQLNLFNLDDQLLVNVEMKKEEIVVRVDADPLGIDLLFEEIEKFDYADLAGEYRRAIQSFREGYIYTQLMSDLDILERKNSKNETKIWGEQNEYKRYMNLLHLKNFAKEQLDEITEMENKLSLACMELETYKPEWSDQLKVWKNNFFGLKVQFYLAANPKKKLSKFRIYGSEGIEVLLDFYTTFFERKKFDTRLKTIWYRESYYKEQVAVLKKGKTIYKPRHEYYVRDWKKGSAQNLVAEEAKDQFCGVEFSIWNSCPSLYLHKEAGLQRWKMEDKVERDFITEVVEADAPFASNIHRKTFFEGKNPFRLVAPNFLEDRVLGIKREVIKKNFLDLIIAILDKQFQKNIDAAML